MGDCGCREKAAKRRAQLEADREQARAAAVARKAARIERRRTQRENATTK